MVSTIWTKVNTLHPKKLCAKLGWNWPSGSVEEDFKKFVNEFSLFRYLSLEKGVTHQLNTLESLSPMDTSCQVCLK